ncbi:hypothetical protein A2982_03985 [candidate division WWE3 bacterium RIFCSPLOWO2_01_FULL_39_13]|uniref:HD domain-containing protein n=1 Tax=candidate division WWE3 bacterium RIFCSPLOWO2_01_FULL_39_13 TaxID=1802624 RepID=A0A1F4V3W9_UNCKA|nr:MAG: hypothetical protein A2982_03985 [candidate division WWE3 bacterium RIFCSPLOWO2_01_FULL_39_13]
MTKQRAIEILEQNMKSSNLRNHCKAVGFMMGGVYDFLSSNVKLEESDPSKEVWETVGILHDSDYELTKDDHEKHTLVALEWLNKEGLSKDDPIYLAIMSHNNGITGLRSPQTQVEWALECGDDLTGFIIAVALVHPDKKLANVTMESVMKKWSQKAFAPGVHRERVEMCEEKIGIPLKDFVEITLKAMQEHAKELGL